MSKHSRNAWKTLMAEAEGIVELIKTLDPPPSRLLVLTEGHIAKTVSDPHLLTLEDLKRMADSLAQRYPKAKKVILRLEPPPPPSPWDLIREGLPEIVEGLRGINPPFLAWGINDEILPPYPWATEEGRTAQEKHGGPEGYLKAILDELVARYPTPPWYVGLYAAWPGRDGFHRAELGYFYAGNGWIDIIVKRNEIAIDLVELQSEEL